ncbi:ion transporter [Sphingobacterium alkalisoli]|uniref:Ion transporter n=1 Tax=Sphingobacterium alkalisoli TaxID=1874115 RepID=A0A4U0H6L2_9SPHI|nr:ion transporter [Sphingobacterium alkalisoli]TJY66934.1 ion transporter [Sphingobacterium alkalisoli]GGH13286.1 ion transporter [Sphingobacterium alkalisoli]
MAKRRNDILRKKIYIVIFRSDTALGKLFDVVLLWLIVLSILSVVLESVESFRNQHLLAIRIAEWFFTACFTMEYALRIYSVHRARRYIFSFYGLIDLLAFLPAYVSLFFAGTQYLVVVRALRLLRVFRILKLTRFLSESNILRTALKASMYKITVFLSSVLTLVTIIGTLMYVIEGGESGFTSIPVSIYWAIVTITTVGYGDISPQSPAGQLLASVLMIIGYGIIAVPTGIVSVEMAKATEGSKRQCKMCQSPIYDPNSRFCSNCGVALKLK